MNKLDEILLIMDKSGTDRISIITDSYLITGHVYSCEECNLNTYINLKDATICLTSDITLEEKCDEYSSSKFDWLHVNFDNIIAFSFIK